MANQSHLNHWKSGKYLSLPQNLMRLRSYSYPHVLIFHSVVDTVAILQPVLKDGLYELTILKMVRL